MSNFQLVLFGGKIMDFKIEIAKLLAAAADISVEDAAAAVEIPAKKEMVTSHTLVSVWQKHSAKHPL